MSSLNLNPNPTVMVVEAGVFLLCFVVVKKMLLEPFLKVHAERLNQTEGNQSQAQQIEQDNIAKAQLIQQRVNEAAGESRQQRDKTVGVAKSRRDELIASSSEEASKIIANMRQELQTELGAERQRIPQLVQNLTREFVQKLLPA